MCSKWWDRMFLREDSDVATTTRFAHTFPKIVAERAAKGPIVLSHVEQAVTSARITSAYNGGYFRNVTFAIMIFPIDTLLEKTIYYVNKRF